MSLILVPISCCRLSICCNESSLAMKSSALPLTFVHIPIFIGAFSIAFFLASIEVPYVCSACWNNFICTKAMHLSIFIVSRMCLVPIVVYPSHSKRSYSIYEPTFLEEHSIKTQLYALSMRLIRVSSTNFSIVFILHCLN